jgi:hypothetical protein
VGLGFVGAVDFLLEASRSLMASRRGEIANAIELLLGLGLVGCDVKVRAELEYSQSMAVELAGLFIS